MSEPVIEFSGVSKKFAKGERHATLRDFIPAMLGKLLGRKRDEMVLDTDEFWAVKDVSFKLDKGQALGIIGPNGSGKSTILKLLSGILRPDKGTYNVKGRLSALIEVGAGFHPDLTGRENVFLNGSILGMTRKEIAAKFEEIVDFAGVREFIDTPLKRYSSGMAVRLGFATSAFIEPDVLLVDEVLAVGDTEFRNRCQHRMEQMRRNGVTMILVSHNLNEVRNLCERTLMLYKGETVMEGPSQKVLERYHQIVSEKLMLETGREFGASADGADKPVRVTKVELLEADGVPAETFMTGAPMTVRVWYDAKKRLERPRFELEMVWASEDWTACQFGNHLDDFPVGPIEGRGYVDLRIEQLLVEPNVYLFNAKLGDEHEACYDQYQRARFIVAEAVPIPGIFGLPHSWSKARPVEPPPKPAVVGAVA
jgi:ABC-type polysaccharide/polyol phosphate transport system ATPase subunit